ncbi:Aldolase-type TIM barrel [Trema orientale]|uniref:Aldolase-type TIM barrel n=1 Tax=Trema orientale TaxID=63057 RepID=A0A2P5FX74_TREOI|nr:Aldolase-type TIM barrel [Trema orientale]
MELPPPLHLCPSLSLSLASSFDPNSSISPEPWHDRSISSSVPSHGMTPFLWLTKEKVINSQIRENEASIRGWSSIPKSGFVRLCFSEETRCKRIGMLFAQLVRRMETDGFRATVLTVDTPRLVCWEADMKNT